MTPTKQDNEVWYVHKVGREIMIDTVKKNMFTRPLECVFEEYEDAQRYAKHLQRVYLETFQNIPDVKIEILEGYLIELLEVELSITEQLSDYPNFDGIHLTDRFTNGVQIKGNHKQVVGYYYGGSPVIRPDFSNYKECIQQFVDAWKASDTKEQLESYNRFLDFGNTYGWD